MHYWQFLPSFFDFWERDVYYPQKIVAKWIGEINVWKYLLWDKKLSFCISSFVFSFELELQINLGWKGLLEVIWSIGSLRFYRFYRLSEYCEWLLSNLSSLGWKVWRSFNAFHLSYSIFSSFWWTLHWTLSRFSVSVLKWRTKYGCIIQGTSAQVLNRVQWSHALTCCRLGHALSSLPQGCSADSHVACHLPAPPSTLQQSWFLDSYNCDLYSWSLYQLSSATKGISRLSAWVILGHGYCSGKRWEQIRCRCLQRDDRMCTHTYTPHLSALIVPKWNWCFNFFKPSGAICFFHLKDNVRAQTVLMLRKKNRPAWPQILASGSAAHPYRAFIEPSLKSRDRKFASQPQPPLQAHGLTTSPAMWSPCQTLSVPICWGGPAVPLQGLTQQGKAREGSERMHCTASLPTTSWAGSFLATVTSSSDIEFLGSRWQTVSVLLCQQLCCRWILPEFRSVTNLTLKPVCSVEAGLHALLC